MRYGYIYEAKDVIEIPESITNGTEEDIQLFLKEKVKKDLDNEHVTYWEFD
jgi:hypothetical protein